MNNYACLGFLLLLAKQNRRLPKFSINRIFVGINPASSYPKYQ